MAHFAKLDENNKVLAVHVVDNNAIDSSNEESSGVMFLTTLHGHDKWKQTSYNAETTRFRFNYAGIGYSWDEVRNAFIPPKPFNSWILNETTCQWEPPTPMPVVEGKTYQWVEDDLNWQEVVFTQP